MFQGNVISQYPSSWLPTVGVVEDANEAAPNTLGVIDDTVALAGLAALLTVTLSAAANVVVSGSVVS